MLDTTPEIPTLADLVPVAMADPADPTMLTPADKPSPVHVAMSDPADPTMLTPAEKPAPVLFAMSDTAEKPSLVHAAAAVLFRAAK